MIKEHIRQQKAAEWLTSLMIYEGDENDLAAIYLKMNEMLKAVKK